MIEINYNDKTYTIDENMSLEQLLQRGDLKGLPMKIWHLIFMEKDHYCPAGLLLKVLLANIESYDKSSNVNSFEYNSNNYWFDKDTRLGLMNLANCSTEKIDWVLGDQIISIEPEQLKEYLKNLEVYAGKCYATTAQHKINAYKLSTIDEFINYDYTANYPDKLVLV